MSDIENKSNEILVLVEKLLIEKVIDVFNKAGISEIDEKSAKIIIAKIGKKFLLEIIDKQ